MSQLGDAVVQYPIVGRTGSVSGTIANWDWPSSTYMRVSQQVQSASMYVVMHPGGSMTGSLQICPANPNRAKFTLTNSGTLAMALEHGTQNFNPNAPVTPTNNYDNIVNATFSQGNTFVPSVDYTEQSPCYTGPVRIGWIGSGTLSGSAAVLCEYSYV